MLIKIFERNEIKMNRLKFSWWGYIKQILYRYPDKCNNFEKLAVEKAIENTEKLKTGTYRMKIISLVFFKKTHKLAGAAMQIPCSYATAKKWQQEFICEVAKNFKCEKLV